MKMTPELAVEILMASEQECWLKGWDKGAAVDYVYNLASKWVVKALEKEPCDDVVSRKAVFETIEDCNSDGLKGIFCSYHDGERFKEYIKNLPPVIPAHITCKDCKHHEDILAAKDKDGNKKILHVCNEHEMGVLENFYCADGERRE